VALASIKQSSILVAVDYYDLDERAKLLLYATSTKIASIAGSVIEVPVAEFLTYYLFHLKRTGLATYGNYHSIGQRIARAEADLAEFVDFNGQSISRAVGVEAQVPRITEHIGEAIGLSVVNRIHGMHEADWTPVPQMAGPKALPTFDFEETASDGHHVVQLEAKGTSATAGNLSAALRTHKAGISSKKAKIADTEHSNAYPYSADIRYGSIAVLPASSAETVRCILVDPPGDASEGVARNLRLLKRQSFMLQWLRLIAPRSEMAIALANRLIALRRLSDPWQLHGVPLVRATGEEFDLQPRDLAGHGAFFQTRSIVADGPAGGVTIQFSSSSLFFLGVREEIVQLAAGQDFEAITTYSAPLVTLEKTVEAVFSAGRYIRLRLPPEATDRVEQAGGYYRLRLKGTLHYSQGGLVFGELPVNAD
jgi:hypothetical protein